MVTFQRVLTDPLEAIVAAFAAGPLDLGGSLLTAAPDVPVVPSHCLASPFSCAPIAVAPQNGPTRSSGDRR